LNLPPELGFEPLVSYPIRCIVGRKNPLFKEQTVTKDQLRDQPFVVFTGRFPQYHEYLKRLLGFEPRIAREYEDDEEFLSAVQRGRGVALLLTTVGAMKHKIKLLPITPHCDPVHVGILYRLPIEPNVEILIKCAKDVLASLTDGEGYTPCQGRIIK